MLRVLSFAVALLATIGPAAAPSAFPAKPIGFSILEDYDKNEDLAEVAKDFDLFRKLGVRVWRGSFGWDDYEPARGLYDFAWLHRFADLAASRGITLRPYIAYTPAWAAAGGRDGEVWNDAPKDLDDWHRFIRALAGAMRRHTNVVSYEIYNEENVPQWWDGSAAQYRLVLGRAVQAVREANPRVQVLLGGMVYPDVRWLEDICGPSDSRPPFALIPFHAYPETWTPRDVTVENYLGPQFGEQFVRAADRACGAKPIWINETGFATTEGRSERDQAEWWLRAAATFLAEPRVEHLGIYEIKDLRPDREAIGGTPNYHLGLTRVDRTPKIAFATLARVVSLLAGEVRVADRALRIAAPSTAGVHGHAFLRRDGRQVVFLWARTAPVSVDVTLPRRGRTLIEYAIDGTPTLRRTLNGSTLTGLQLTADHVRLFEIRP